MIRNKIKSILLLPLLILAFTLSVAAQDTVKVTGKVIESGSSLPLQSVLISISGENTTSNEDGTFQIEVANTDAAMVVQLPGYKTRQLRLNGRTDISISLVKNENRSFDDEVVSPTGTTSMRDITQSSSYLNSREISMKANSSLDQVMQGKLMGTQVISGSGMPGSKAYVTVRGLSSLYGSNEPLLMIDGMIHPLDYGNQSVIEGFSLNPFDVIDVDDVESISVLSDGNSYMGSNGANGILYVNLEKKGETSSRIAFNAYGGIAVAPKRMNLLDGQEFNSLLAEQISQSGMSQEEIDFRYSFLNAEENSEDYYRYNNNTNWQDEIYRVGIIQKYHMFLKGGDDIATYNISTGYLMHDGILKNTHYDRFNVRINGKVNITDKFTVLPNTKVSLSDSYLMEQGPTMATNPILAAQAKAPIMAPNKFDSDGTELEFIDDLGAFNASNPAAITKNLEGTNRNYHFITSVKAIYAFNRNLSLSTFLGIDFNNSRDNIFIPDVGLTKIDSAYNASKALVNEFRSTQNQNELTYNKSFNGTSNLKLQVGHRYMNNFIGYDDATDLNSATDDFRSLGQGAYNSELRTVGGLSRVVKWVSYYTIANYNLKDKYYLTAALSYDINSNIHQNSRANFYPSLSGAWRLSSEPFLSGNKMIDDLKIRASFSQAGNMNNTMYDYSKLYYRGIQMNLVNLVARESIPNPDMELEKKTTINVGADVSMLNQTLTFSANYFYSLVDNMVIDQTIAPAFGFTSYYNNGGSLVNNGVELAFNYRQQFGSVNWKIGGTASFIDNKVNSLDFMLDGMDKIVHDGQGYQLVTQAGSPLYAYYGYETDGLYNSDDEASKVTGPNGQRGQAGDIRFVDQDNNGIINEYDKTEIGSPIANLFGGLYTAVEWGNFEFKADFSFNSGNDLYNYTKRLGQSMELGYNQHSEVLNHWTESNTNTDIPRIAVGDPYGNNVFSDRWIEKGDYVRLKNLTVSYKYPEDSPYFSNLTFYVTATNLLTVSPYSGLDPEFMYINNPLYLGTDYGKIPQPKTFVIGVKLAL